VYRIPSFVWGHVLSALLLGFIGGVFFNLTALLAFCGVMAGCALASALICRLWPGFAALGWKLWLVAAIANPLFLVAAFFAIQDLDCLTGAKTGWDCLFSEAYPMAMAICLIPPLFGLAVRWLAGKAVKS
jgi:hypothetical protein